MGATAAKQRRDGHGGGGEGLLLPPQKEADDEVEVKSENLSQSRSFHSRVILTREKGDVKKDTDIPVKRYLLH